MIYRVIWFSRQHGEQCPDAVRAQSECVIHYDGRDYCLATESNATARQLAEAWAAAAMPGDYHLDGADIDWSVETCGGLDPCPEPTCTSHRSAP